jgi:hypothetical protein
MNSITWRLDTFQGCEGRAQHSKLTGDIARLAQSAPQRILDRRDTRRGNSLRQYGDGSQDDRRKSSSFDFTLY